MNLEFDLVVDGVVRGRVTFTMTPMGLGVTATGDVEFRSVQQKPNPAEVLNLRDLLPSYRLPNN